MNAYQEFAINYFQDEDGMFTAEVPAIPGCFAWGKDLEETYANAIEAIESCLEARQQVGAMVETAATQYKRVNVYRRLVNA